MNIYVGNLSYQVTDEDLRSAFQNYGEVSSATVIMDKFSNRSKGFGFVEMVKKEDGETAIKEMNNTDLKGRQIVVNQARPRSEEPRRERFGDRQKRF
ncbi:RNA recognition motif domain-containing protein [Candidatus Nitrosoglobus terrae]|uniref:RNA recognition motif domain-containing protein n=1 Tax=Candidatus Nitrosoglobus terrae TaxID=1630141 RepID=UPI00155421B9|nr:RNA-binding protein [Candidatus Nitrosoglobus terrae]